ASVENANCRDFLCAGRGDPPTSALAKALQNALLNKWLMDKLQSKGVFKKLSLGHSMKDVPSDLN
ncbi:hypothetical protein L916_14483, partial [Phytophthora nicotianae]